MRVSTSSFFIGLTLLATTAGHVPHALGQCFPTWADNGVMLPTFGPGNDIQDAAMWDTDGGGPLPAVLVVASLDGVFTWDGAEWSRLGEFGQSPSTANQIAIYNGQPVVRCDLAGFHGAVARWNGNGWLVLGDPGGNVSDMAVYNGALVLAGNLLNADGSATHNVIQWDGAAWHAMGTGVPARGMTMTAADIDSLGPSPNALYVGCENGSILRWNGVSWQALPSFDTTPVTALAAHDGQLYGASRLSGSSWLSQLRRWSEGAASWTVVIGNVQHAGGNGLVTALLSWSGSLIVGGHFETVGPANSLNVARLTGNTYSSMATGVGSGQAWFQVNALAAAPGSPLYAVGDFYDMTGASPAFLRHCAAWDGVAWSAPVSPGQVLALAPFGTRMALGGWFSAGDVWTPQPITHQLALWDGLTMSPLGGGLGASANAAIRALREFGSTANTRSLVVAGDFTSVSGSGGGAANRVAKWNQSDTSPLLTGWAAMGSGFNAAAHVLEVDYNGALVAGGAFTASGATALNRIAKWNGSAWVPYATAPTTDMNGAVRALKAYLPNPTSGITKILIAGGDFVTANGNTVNRIAIWTDSLVNGTTPWTAMGSGFNGTVYAIERFNGSTYAAGAFTMSGAFNVNKIARWNGSSWLVVGNGIGFDGPVFALRTFGNALYAAGTFTNVDGLPIRSMAKWDGTAWSAITADDDAGRFAINAYNGELLFAGNAKRKPSNFSYQVEGVRRYLPTGAPWIAQQPSSQSRDCGQTATFTVTLAEGYSSQYAWRRNGVPLTNGVTPHGSVITMSSNGLLSIANAKAADAGDYDCVCTSACGSATSTPATLTINTCCVADIAPIGSLDGQVNVADLLAVITAWGTCANCASCPADIAPAVHDCQVNVADLLAVISAWGACP